MSSRGKNYTEREKCKLLELVQKYKHIIGNKVTNAVTIVKKNEAWGCITAEYNSTAEVPRTQKQLNTAYLNLKRSTRQKVATENVKKYLEPRQNNTVVDCEAGPSQCISLSDESNTQTKTEEIKCILGKFKKDETTDKMRMMCAFLKLCLAKRHNIQYIKITMIRHLLKLIQFKKNVRMDDMYVRRRKAIETIIKSKNNITKQNCNVPF